MRRSNCKYIYSKPIYRIRVYNFFTQRMYNYVLVELCMYKIEK